MDGFLSRGMIWEREKGEGLRKKKEEEGKGRYGYRWD